MSNYHTVPYESSTLSPSDWVASGPQPVFDLGTEVLLISTFSALGIWFVLIKAFGWSARWALLGVALLPFTLVLLVLWSILPVWLTRAILVGGVIDQAFFRNSKPARRPVRLDHRFSRN